MKTVKVRAILCPDNVVETDQSSADAMVATGRWEEVTPDDGSKPAGRRRTPRSSTAT